MTPVLWVAVMLLATALIYAVAVGAYWFANRPWMALTFVGYVIANIGLIGDALGGMK